MQRETLGRRGGRLLRVRWTLRRTVGLAGGLGLIAALGIVALLVIRGGTWTSAACEAATLAPPDFEAAPFTFDPEARALAFVQAMAMDDFQTAYEMLASEFMNLDPLCEHPGGGQLETLWRETVQGRQVDIEAASTQLWRFGIERDVLDVLVRVPYDEQNPPASAAYLRVGLQRDGRVSSVDVDQARTQLGPVSTFAPPPYADLTAFRETELTLGAAPWSLGATLTTPSGPGPFPAVALIPWTNFSGRDGTTGANKAFRDLAWGLATQGVASLRYDSRMWTHALAFARQADFTLADQAVDDALTAVAVLRTSSRIDPARVFVLGGGFNGFAAPRVALRDPAIAGLILYSAGSGQLVETWWRRFQRYVERAGTGSELEQRARRRAGEILQARIAASLASAKAEGEVRHMSVRASYHRDLVGYQPEVVARTLPMPILVLHGWRDHATTAPEVYGWVRNLYQRPDAAFRMYDHHSHGLLDTREMTGPDIRRAGHVGVQVVNDIAVWIGETWPTQPCVDSLAWSEGCRGGPDAVLREFQLALF